MVSNCQERSTLPNLVHVSYIGGGGELIEEKNSDLRVRQVNLQTLGQPLAVIESLKRNAPHSGSDGKKSACSVGDLGSIPGSGKSFGKENGNNSRIPVWRVPWTEEPGRLQSMGLQRVAHDLLTNSCTFHFPSKRALVTHAL